MHRAGLSRKDMFNPAERVGNAVIAHSRVPADDIDSVYTQPNGTGLLIAVKSGKVQCHLLLHDLRRVDSAKEGDRNGPLSVAELSAFIFDPAADIDADQQLFEGLICQGDLTIWLGREKHRKSNLILQFVICAATGRNFLGFRFVARRPLRVVLIDFESKSGSLKQRYEGIITALDVCEDERTMLLKNLRILEVRKIRKSGRAFPKFPHKAGADAKFWEDLVVQHPADLYVIDPLRTLHAADENDSSIETLLSEMQRVFRGAAVIAAHHMRKPNDNAGRLSADMRAWSEGARGSSAIKAHSDVIVLQERSMDEKQNEVVHLGVFLKDGPDVEPMPLMESDHQSFFWEMVPDVPEHLQPSYDALMDGAGRYKGKARAVAEIVKSTHMSRATAYRHVDSLIRCNLLGGGEPGWLSVQKLTPEASESPRK